ncbi:helix-turn-helix domain-containing protein [Flavobacterium luteolum]|uniref:helix-turn-helix domain-containing protein n=1 Tax=Flavobacterium luteolum TaxID=3003259 RepID=UPI00248D3B44|nr:helix-turn-helix domain-containing protein [Flavobacterium luteolum]
MDEKLLVFPEKLGLGHTFFIQVVPGVAAIVMDFTLSSELKINRIKDGVNRYVFHFDLSEQENKMHLESSTYKMGNNIKRGLSIFKNQGKYCFEPVIGHRIFALRLFIDNLLMNELIEENPESELIKKAIVFDRKKIYIDDLDADSLLQLINLKDMSFRDSSYEVSLKGISLRLISNVLLKLGTVAKSHISAWDEGGILKAEAYLLSNIDKAFPTIQVLAQKAGMSETKFKNLFKKYFKKTAQNMFHEAKMKLAHEKLLSGNYYTLTELVEDLNYSQLNYFSELYFKFFRRRPIHDFIKKNDYRKNEN